MISKKLLSEIFNEEVDFIDKTLIHKKTGTYLPIRFEEGNYHEMPLTFLIQKCKEWAINNNVCIISKFCNTRGTAWVEWYIEYKEVDWSGYIRGHTYKEKFDADTESQAVFKACEWILKQKEQT